MNKYERAFDRFINYINHDGNGTIGCRPPSYDDIKTIEKAINIVGDYKPTLRDQFAMAALAGWGSDDDSAEGIAKKAYEIADAMLAEREKGGE